MKTPSFRRPGRGVAAFASSSALALAMSAHAPDAHACGGCFVPPSSSSVVDDHRMVLSISTKQTVLWDQIRYSGNPAEFAWVLPVKSGARLELARDEWLAALDATTQPTVVGPTPSCGSSSSGGGLGCASSSLASSASDYAQPPVEVIHQAVVGPYETVTLRARDPDALPAWLRAHDFAIPPSIEPTLAAYVAEKFDFMALRLRPGQDVRAMQPVRVVTAGASPVLPLRMVAAGVGANVEITLFVITESRFHPTTFPDAVFDDDKLVWDGAASRSNYEELARAAMAGGAAGPAFLTEASFRLRDPVPSPPFRSRPPLSEAYRAQCANAPARFVPCADASTKAPETGPNEGADGGAGSAADDASSAPSAAPDASTRCGQLRACEEFDDYAVAMEGLHADDVWITRLRARLPVASLTRGDLTLGPAEAQTPVSGIRGTNRYSDPSYDPCPGGDDSSCAASPAHDGSPGTLIAVGLVALGGAALSRRRRRGPSPRY